MPLSGEYFPFLSFGFELPSRLLTPSAHLQIYFGISAPFSSLSLFTPSITAGLGVCCPWIHRILLMLTYLSLKTSGPNL